MYFDTSYSKITEKGTAERFFYSWNWEFTMWNNDIRNIKTIIVKFVGSHCPQTNLEQKQNLTIGLDTTAPNIYQVHWRKTDAIFKTNKNVNISCKVDIGIFDLGRIIFRRGTTPGSPRTFIFEWVSYPVWPCSVIT